MARRFYSEFCKLQHGNMDNEKNLPPRLRPALFRANAKGFHFWLCLQFLLLKNRSRGFRRSLQIPLYACTHVRGGTHVASFSLASHDDECYAGGAHEQ